MDISIRKIDAEEIEYFAEMLFQSELGKTYYPRKDIMMIGIKKAYESCDEHLIVAISKGVLAGALWYKERGAFHIYPYLHMITVKKQFRRCGIANHLISYFEEHALYSEGLKKISSKVFLCVAQDNEAANLLYLKRGYEEIGKIDGLFKKRVTEIYMMKQVVRGKI